MARGEKKVCPILTINSPMTGCEEEKCAWWHEPESLEGFCALAELPKIIQYIERALERDGP